MDEYKKLGRIGGEGICKVYKGKDPITSENICIKECPYTPSNRENIQESAALQLLFSQYPMFIKTLNLHIPITPAEQMWRITELCDYSLERRIVASREESEDEGSMIDALTNQPFTDEELLVYVREIIEGIYLLHKQGYAHRQLTTRKILVRGKHIKIDLGGNSPVQGDRESLLPWIVGLNLGRDLPFLPPEERGQLELGRREGQLPIFPAHDPFKMDIWAIGVLLYFMAQGVDKLPPQTHRLTITNPKLKWKDLFNKVLRVTLVGREERATASQIREILRESPYINSLHTQPMLIYGGEESERNKENVELKKIIGRLEKVKEDLADRNKQLESRTEEMKYEEEFEMKVEAAPAMMKEAAPPPAPPRKVMEVEGEGEGEIPQSSEDKKWRRYFCWVVIPLIIILLAFMICFCIALNWGNKQLGDKGDYQGEIAQMTLTQRSLIRGLGACQWMEGGLTTRLSDCHTGLQHSLDTYALCRGEQEHCAFDLNMQAAKLKHTQEYYKQCGSEKLRCQGDLQGVRELLANCSSNNRDLGDELEKKGKELERSVRWNEIQGAANVGLGAITAYEIVEEMRMSTKEEELVGEVYKLGTQVGEMLIHNPPQDIMLTAGINGTYGLSMFNGEYIYPILIGNICNEAQAWAESLLWIATDSIAITCFMEHNATTILDPFTPANIMTLRANTHVWEILLTGGILIQSTDLGLVFWNAKTGQSIYSNLHIKTRVWSITESLDDTQKNLVFRSGSEQEGFTLEKWDITTGTQLSSMDIQGGGFQFTVNNHIYRLSATEYVLDSTQGVIKYTLSPGAYDYTILTDTLISYSSAMINSNEIVMYDDKTKKLAKLKIDDKTITYSSTEMPYIVWDLAKLDDEHVIFGMQNSIYIWPPPDGKEMISVATDQEEIRHITTRIHG